MRALFWIVAGLFCGLTLWLLVAAGGDQPRVVESPVVLRWIEGEQRSYRLAFESKLKMPAQELPQQFRGRLDLLIERVESEQVTLRCCLREPGFGGILELEPELQAELSSPIRVMLRLDGGFLALSAPGLGERARDLLDACWRKLHCSMSIEPEWTVEELCLGRVVEARYRRLADGRIEKRLFREAAREDQELRLLRLDSTTVLRPSADASWFDFVDLREHAEFTIAGEGRCRSRLSLALRALPRPVTESIAEPLSLVDDTRSGVVTEVETVTAEVSGQDRHRFLAVVDALLGSEEVDRSMLDELERLLSLHPELAGLIPPLIHAGVSDAGAANLIHLLELVGHARCQQALCEIAVQHRSTLREQLRALIALGGLRAPRADSLAFLREVSHWQAVDPQRAHTAMLALGALAPRLEASSDAAALRDELAFRLSTSQTDKERIVLLDALANTRDSAACDALAACLDSGSPRLQAHAASALARLPGADSEARLVDLLHSSEDQRLRGVAAKGLAGRSAIQDETREAGLRMLDVESDTGVRLGLARLLARQLPDHPEMRLRLLRALEEESDDRVRIELLKGFAATEEGVPRR